MPARRMAGRNHPGDRADDLADFHRLCYGPKGMVIAIVGAIEPESAVEQVVSALGDWTNLDQMDLPALPPLKRLKKPVTRRKKILGKSQADLVIGASGPYRKDPEYIADSLGNSALGQFGLGGRIGNVVREKSGLAYYASQSERRYRSRIVGGQRGSQSRQRGKGARLDLQEIRSSSRKA